MNNKESYIRRYFDEELSESEEEIFFSELSTNSSMRKDFNFYMKLSNVKDEIISSTSVPAEAEAALFSALGYSALSRAGGLKQNFLQKFFPHSITALVTAVSTLLLSYFAFSPGEEKFFAELKENSLQEKISSKKENFIPDKPEEGTSKKIFVSKENFSSYDEKENFDNDKIFTTKSTDGLREEISFVGAMTENTILKLEAKGFSTENLSGNILPASEGDANSRTNFSVELTGFAKLNQNQKFALPTNSDITNVSAALYYGLSDNFFLGCETGLESIYQSARLSSPDFPGVVEIHQKPTLWYGGINARYTNNFFFGNTSWHAQFLIGMSRIGPAGYAQLGLQYEFGGNAYSLLGCKASAFFDGSGTFGVSGNREIVLGLGYRF